MHYEVNLVLAMNIVHSATRWVCVYLAHLLQRLLNMMILFFLVAIELLGQQLMDGVAVYDKQRHTMLGLQVTNS